MGIKSTKGTVNVKKQVLTLSKVSIADKPTLSIDMDKGYTVTVATMLEGNDKYSAHASGFFKLFGSNPFARAAQTKLNTLKALVKIATGQAAYTMTGGLSEADYTEIAKARTTYDNEVEGQRALVGKFNKPAQYVTVNEQSETVQNIREAKSELEDMTKRK